MAWNLRTRNRDIPQGVSISKGGVRAIIAKAPPLVIGASWGMHSNSAPRIKSAPLC